MSRNKQFLLLALVPSYFMVVGLMLQPFPEILQGLIAIIEEPDFLITDYFVIGGMGAAFINASILALISLGMIYKLGMEVDGHTITSVCLMFGFSLFGKNILNIWLILLGVYLYAHYHKTCLSKYIYIGLYGTSLSPIITQVMQMGDLPVEGRMILCVLTGIVIGFVLPPLASHVHHAHQGYSLYNVGFASGIIATVIVSIFKSFGIEIQSRLIWSTGNNMLLLGLLFTMFFGMIVMGISQNPNQVIKKYKNILNSTGVSGTDYLKEQGGAATILNMGVNGIITTLFVVVVGGELNGPTIGAIFTVIGFSATGKHARNILPIMLGVYLASLAKLWSIQDPSAILALIFATTLAPIAGEFGIIAGIIAGILHSSVSLNVGIVYGGMNLYNQGFAGGLVAVFMVPAVQSIRDRQARAESELSL